MRKLFILSLISLLTFNLKSQELNCEVNIISPKLKSSPENVLIFDALKQSIFDFMNNTEWTDDVFQGNEKIECSFLITINEKLSSNEFSGTIQIQSRRPVFNSNYSTTLLNHVDKDFKFTFERNTQVVFVENQFTNNLSSILAFYAYLIIGTDYDSFSLEGGTPYFIKAQQIVNQAQTSGANGWKASENTRNRFWLVENILHVVFKPMRRCMYEYHRLGFDELYNEPIKGRNIITNCFNYLINVHNLRPLSINMKVFFNAKVDEIVNLFSEATPQEKDKVHELAKRLDPGNIAKYDKMKKG